MTKEEKVKVFEDTVKIVKQGYYDFHNEKSGEIEKIMIDNALDKDYGFESYPYSTECKCKFLENIPRNIVNDVRVVNMDCLECAASYISGKRPLVLNMASYHTPGGGVLKGSSAQEEELFRRTNLFTALYPYHKKYADMFDIKCRENMYPLDAFSDFGCIYTQSVTVFKGKESEGYKLLGYDQFKIDVITIPAIRLPSIKPDGTLSERDRQITKNKIEQIFNVGANHENDILILSAFGCGAYGNPPSEIATLFKEVIESEKYYGVFDTIVFAILDDKNAFKEHNKEGNFKVFNDILG